VEKAGQYITEWLKVIHICSLNAWCNKPQIDQLKIITVPRSLICLHWQQCVILFLYWVNVFFIKPIYLFQHLPFHHPWQTGSSEHHLKSQLPLKAFSLAAINVQRLFTHKYPSLSTARYSYRQQPIQLCEL